MNKLDIKPIITAILNLKVVASEKSHFELPTKQLVFSEGFYDYFLAELEEQNKYYTVENKTERGFTLFGVNIVKEGRELTDSHFPYELSDNTFRAPKEL